MVLDEFFPDFTRFYSHEFFRGEGNHSVYNTTKVVFDIVVGVCFVTLVIVYIAGLRESMTD